MAALEVYSERMKEASALANVEYPVASPAFGESADKADQAHRGLMDRTTSTARAAANGAG